MASLTRPTAHNLGVKTLFRYDPYPVDDKRKRDWVDDLLTKGRLYLRRAEELNDPFEARPHFCAPDPDPIKAQYKAIKYFRTRQAKLMGWSVAQARAYERQLTPVFLAEQRQLMEAEWRVDLARDYPMCCFAKEKNTLPMWAHYAQSHTGLVIHFDATFAPIGNAQLVNYQEPYPEVPIPPVDLELDQIVERCLLTKSILWAHEQEFRMIDFPLVTPRGSHSLDAVVRRVSEQVVELPPHVVTGITLGVRMPDPLKVHLTNLATVRSPALKVWRADIEHAEFAMRFEPIK